MTAAALDDIGKRSALFRAVEVGRLMKIGAGVPWPRGILGLVVHGFLRVQENGWAAVLFRLNRGTPE